MANNFGHIITNNEEIRIVMVGKTGIGKSATGNSILGWERFRSKCSAKSMTEECSKDRTVVDGQKVAVIDTPGLFDTRFGEERTAKDVSQCISYACPGPHIFLVVIAVGRFTQEEKLTVQKIQEIFGAAADKYSMVLFTHGDQLDGSIEEFLGESPDLQELVSRCNGQFHVFNNKLADKKPQVRELLQKIKAIVQRNGGSHYTNQMFQEAERAVEEKKQKILREKEEKIRREKEEMERELQQKYQKEMQRMSSEFQAQREREKREMEEERRRQRVEMEEERRKEKQMRKEEWEEMKAKREMEMERREAEMERQRARREKEMQDTMKKMQEEHERDLKRAKDNIQRKHESESRGEAEDSNPFGLIGKGFKLVWKGIKSLF